MFDVDIKNVNLRLEEAIDDEYKYLIWPMKVASYVQGERPSGLLARLARGERGKTSIDVIQDVSGAPLMLDRDIQNRFCTYFSEFYAARVCTDAVTPEGYLAEMLLPRLDVATRDRMERDLEEVEIREAVKSCPMGKTPGPDGLPNAFYGHFIDLVAPLLLACMKEMVETGEVPRELSEATIVLLLKPDKDPTQVESYRPLSLINQDMKILAKMLALRIQDQIPGLVSVDQNGFVGGRSTSDNLRRLSTVMQHTDPSSHNSIVLFDAAKAFDSVSWRYLFAVLAEMGMGPKFCSLIRLLYTSPSARILVNGALTQRLEIERGTRQGCPLSPLLFILAIEPLAIRLRGGLHDDGIIIGDCRLLVSLYADDLLLYLRDPRDSIGRALEIIGQFGEVSGVLMNWGKSVVCPLAQGVEEAIEGTELRYSPSGFKYLGMYVTMDEASYFAKNLEILFEYFKPKIDRWLALPLTLAGRVALLKMVVLPRFVYIFANYFLPLTAAFFKRCDRLCRTLLWGNKQARISYQVLTRPYDMGGIAAPNFQLYYEAAQLRYLVPLLSSETPPHMIELDKTLVGGLLPEALINIPHLRSRLHRSPLKVAIGVLYNRCKREGNECPFLADTPLKCSLFSILSHLRMLLPEWEELGLAVVGDMFVGDSLMPKNQLLTLVGRSLRSAFGVHQFYSLYKQYWNTQLIRPPESATLQLLYRVTDWNKLITHIYDGLLRITHAEPIAAKEKWEVDIGRELSQEEWMAACRHVREVGTPARYRLIQYKYLTRYYMTPVRISKFVPDFDASCPRCKSVDAGLLHLIWSCPIIVLYWDAVFAELGKILDFTLPRTIEVTFLGGKPGVSGVAKKFVSLALLLAKREIARLWMRPTPPTLDGWIRALLYTHDIESRFIEHLPRANRPTNIWQWFVDYLQQMTPSPVSTPDTRSPAASPPPALV